MKTYEVKVRGLPRGLLVKNGKGWEWRSPGREVRKFAMSALRDDIRREIASATIAQQSDVKFTRTEDVPS